MLCLLLVLCVIVITILLLKLYLLRKSLREVEKNLAIILSEDTNLLLTVSSRDKAVRRLANQLNAQLLKLRRARLRYEYGDRELKEAVANISHDLRTPLTALSGYMELLKKEAHTPSSQRYLSIMEGRITSMKQLTEELFCYALVHRPQEEQPEALSLNHTLEDVLVSFYAAFSSKGITPVIQIPELPVMRVLEPISLRRVFENIIHNAIKYSAGDLSVTLTEDGTVTFVNAAPNLTPVTTAKLFDRFYTVETVDASETEAFRPKGGGSKAESAGIGLSSTGLGLSIARRLVERMDGTISAAYKNGELYITVQFP